MNTLAQLELIRPHKVRRSLGVTFIILAFYRLKNLVTSESLIATHDALLTGVCLYYSLSKRQSQSFYFPSIARHEKFYRNQFQLSICLNKISKW